MPTNDLSSKVKAALAAVPYFANLDAGLIEFLVQQTKYQHYNADQVVFLEGEQDVALHIVDYGWLKAIKISPDGREQVLHFIGAGEVFNEIGVFAEESNPKAPC